jgi:putative SOS response-associated peptidase YedK
MCGRFEIHSAIEIILRLFQIEGSTFDVQPNYNIAPSQEIAIVVNDGRNRLVSGVWGFVPSWSREQKTGYRMINARAETLTTNRSFKDAFRTQRCLVPADGFFEWSRQGAVKTPQLIRLRSHSPMAFAGLYSIRTSPEGEEIRTCTIITTEANEQVARLHDRMPAIIPEDHYGLWLDPLVHDPKELLPLLKPYPAEELELFPVTPKMNSYKYNDPENIKPVPI